MVTCDLDKHISGEVLGLKLPAWQALLYHRVLPSCGGLLVYLTLICFDYALVFEHWRNGDNGLAAFSIILMTLPALVSLVFTLASPPPGLQTDLTAYSVNVERNDLIWVLTQIISSLFYQIATIGRYVAQIFWCVEAVFASYAEDEERIKEAIAEASRPSSMELYLFLQAFLHSAPFAIMNILDLMSKLSTSTFDKVSVQSVSIIVSCLRMAGTATMYRRFEREKLCGRNYPWRNKNTENNNILITNKVLSFSERKKVFEDHIYEPILKRKSTATESSFERSNLNSDLIQFSPRTTASASFQEKAKLERDSSGYDQQSTVASPTFYEQVSDVESEISSDYLPPISTKDEAHDNPQFESDDEYMRPVSIIDRVAPKRRSTAYTVEQVNITPPPAMHAPRPGSIAVWAEKLVENAESIPIWLSAPHRSKYGNEFYGNIQDEPDIPTRVPRTYMRGLEPQDVTAALVHYLGWYMFFISRLVSIACFINFFPFIAIVLLFSHYQIMLLFLIVPQASTIRRAFYIFLAFIYLFCLMEFKIRFRHVRVWHVFWITVCTMETVVFVVVWATIDNTVDPWWRSFLVFVGLGGMSLSYICFLVYFVILKPKEAIVYFKNKNINQ